MVKKIDKEGKEYYQCEECKLIYKEEGIAKKCENWCKENKSCNIGIAKFRVLSETEVSEVWK